MIDEAPATAARQELDFGRRPLRRRLRRRHAADRQPVRRGHRARRQRSRHLPRFPGRDPRAGRHHLRRLGLPDQFRRARDQDRRAMRRTCWSRSTRRRSRSSSRELKPRRHRHRRYRRVHRAQPAQGRLRRQSARPTAALDALPRHRGRHLAADARGGQAARARRSTTRCAARTCGRSASSTGCSIATAQPTVDWLDAALRRRARRSPRPTSRRSTPATPSARPPSCTATCSTLHGRAGAARARASTARSPAARRWPAGWSSGAHLAGLQLFFASYPITPASPLLHTLAGLRDLGVTTFQAEDEIAAVCAAIGASYAGALGVTSQLRARASRSRARRSASPIAAELPLVDRQLAARRPVDRPADEDRAVRPLPGGLRPQRRDARSPVLAAAHARRLLRGRDRGGAHRVAVHDAGDPADRRLHRQRRASRGGCRTSTRLPPFPVALPRTRRRKASSRSQRDPETLAPAVGQRRARRASSTASAASRRTSHRQHLLRPATITSAMTDAARGQDRRAIADDIPPQTVELGREQGRLAVVGWGSTYGPISRAVRALPERGLRRRAHPPAPSLARCRATSASCCAASTAILVPEMNTGQLVDAAARAATWSPAEGAQQGLGPAVQDRRDRAAIRQPGRRAGRGRASSMNAHRALQLHAKDFASDQEVRWCPGCGDYAILKAVQKTLADIGADPAKTVFVSGIGCSSRFPYYMDDLRLPHHPRPRAGGRDRRQARQSRARRLDRHRRRRRPVDRRQPPAARAAPQRRPADPAVQQRDLRPDQGPVLADLAARHALAVVAAAARSNARSRRRCSRSAPARASSRARSTRCRSTWSRC